MRCYAGVRPGSGAGVLRCALRLAGSSVAGRPDAGSLHSAPTIIFKINNSVQLGGKISPMA